MRQAHPAFAGVQAGMTLIEVMLAMMITLLAGISFFQLFAFGTVELEKLGYRREAMSLLTGEMEFWRARFQVASARNPVGPDEADRRRRTIQSVNGMEFQVEPEVFPVVYQEGRTRLRYQKIHVSVSYARGDLTEDLALETDQYVW